MKFLIVDDSRAVHAFLVDMLADSGVTLVSVHNGEEAVRVVSSPEFSADLVLLDWEMPVLSGIDALPKLKAALGRTPIVMMTSKNALADIALALERGASDYVIKPFTKEILTDKIAQTLKREVA